MLELHGLNYLAVLVAWLINMGVGAFWYSPAGFGPLWSKLSGVNLLKIPKAEANRAIGFVAVSSLVQAWALALVLHSLHAANLADGLLIGLVLWFGFTAATTVGNTLYARQSWTFWWLNASFFFVVMVINSLLLTLWR